MICPLCSQKNTEIYLKRKDSLPVHLCPSCDLRFVSRTEHEELYGRDESIYDHKYFETERDIGFKAYEDCPINNFLWQRAFTEIIVRDLRGKRILDIGCGTGKFLELLREHGAEAEGIEISAYAAGIASSKGFTIYNQDIMSFQQEAQYDVITAFDLIEHIPDTKAFLRKVFGLLTDDGVFIFMTPDAGSQNARTQRENWYGYMSSLEHLYYFSTSPLRYIFKDTFGNEPFLYQATAADGEGIFGFIRKSPVEDDALVWSLFAENFPPALINDSNVLQVCTLLQRFGDERFREYAQKFNTEIAKSGRREGAVLRSQLQLGTQQRESGKKILVRPYQDGDEKGIVRLFQEVFGRKMTIDEWEWKYKGQGNEAVSAVVAVNEAGEIVGHYGGIPLRATYNGNLIHILATCDVMIHPSSRGFWMLKRITAFFKHEAIKKAFRMCYGFPTEKTLMLPAEKLGIIERCTNIFEAYKDVSLHNNLNRFLFRLSPMPFDDARINCLWKSVRETRSFAVIRDTDYLAWRYGQNPCFSYQIWGLTRRWDKQLLGAAITRNDLAKDLMLIDLICLEKLIVPLLQKVENLAISMGKKRILLWMPERYHPLLRNNGFSQRECGVLGKFPEEEFISKQTAAHEFYYSMGDTDYR
jgi:2-polyprenyl-3-methyl-5-hydroxy-6-metoxy-1,4-benzoquinol methylase